MNEMKESGIQWMPYIPYDWSVRKVKHAFIRQNEKAGQESPIILSLARSGVKVRDLSNNEGQIAESYYNYNPVQEGDLLLNPMDLYSGANCSYSKVSGVISPAYVNLRAKSDYCAPYYDYYFKVQYWMMAFFAHGKGVSFDNRWTLNIEILFNYPIIVPPFSQQEKIARHLEKLCSEISDLQQKTSCSIEEYKKLKQGIISNSITRGISDSAMLKDSGIEWIGKIVKDWEIGKIKYGTTKVGSGKTPSGGAETYVDEGILFIRSQNVYDTGLVLDNPTFIAEDVDQEMKNTRVYPKDVLLNITGGSIGRCCVFPEELERANVNQHVSIIRTIDSVFLPEFIHYYWMSSLGKNSINMLQTGGNREGMTADAIKNSYIPMIPIQEQKEIIEFLDKKCIEMDKLIQKKEDMLSELETYKRTAIYEYVTGIKEA